MATLFRERYAVCQVAGAYGLQSASGMFCQPSKRRNCRDYGKMPPYLSSLIEKYLTQLKSPGKGQVENGKPSLSPIILNPGGPGGSGVQLVLGLGSTIQQMLGEEYDVVSFDPRGVGYTTPTADCFSFPPAGTDVDEDDIAQGQFNRLEFAISNEAVGLVNSSDVALTKLDNAARSVAQMCKEKDALKGKNSILRHLDTPNVARDMVSIIDAWDVWRDTLLNQDEILHEEIAEIEEGQANMKHKLVYAGFSYGETRSYRLDEIMLTSARYPPRSNICSHVPRPSRPSHP